MEYFDFTGLEQFSSEIGTVYNGDSPGTKWFNDTRNKLRKLVDLINDKSERKVSINYNEKPNKQAGQGMGFVLKDYILVGFIPTDYLYEGDQIFIKFSLHSFEKNKAVFAIEIDINFKKGNNPYKIDRETLVEDTKWEMPFDDTFPPNWDALLTMIIPIVEDKIKYLDNYLNTKAQTQIDQIDENKLPTNVFALNQILFGPPGTGKTYNTINRALEILGASIEGITRKEMKDLFDLKIKEGQIAFTTFHQSMSYEDFIEGIKPQSTDKFVRYDIVDGIFKSICKRASSRSRFTIKINEEILPLTKDLFEEYYDTLVELLPKHEESRSEFKLKTKENNEFELFRNTAGSIVVRAGQKRTNSVISLNELSLVIFESKIPTYRSYEQPIIDKIFEGLEFSSSKIDNSTKNFVLIIDEINRGNVSQIFGELITLIEDDKRLGKEESIEAILPYSKEKFGVPSNLYIIGTMNTADRSVEALDAALRRRFSFEEMMPRPELITPSEILRRFWISTMNFYGGSEASYNSFEREIRELLGLKIHDMEKYISYGDDLKATFELDEFNNKLKDVIEFDGINLAEILTLINKRIEKLLDKDHQIGHSYFMNVYSIEDLKVAFQNKIIPLLQEYFFGDYGKIGLILGKGFVEINQKQTVFAEFDSELASELSERPSYTLKNALDMDDDKFKAAIRTLMASK